MQSSAMSLPPVCNKLPNAILILIGYWHASYLFVVAAKCCIFCVERVKAYTKLNARLWLMDFACHIHQLKLWLAFARYVLYVVHIFVVGSIPQLQAPSVTRPVKVQK